MEAIRLSATDFYKEFEAVGVLHGIVRLPTNLIMGVRSAATAARRTFVANILRLGLTGEKGDEAGNGFQSPAGVDLQLCSSGEMCCVLL